MPDEQELLIEQNMCILEYQEVYGQQVVVDAQQKYNNGEFQEALVLLEDYLKDGSENKNVAGTYEEYIAQYTNELAGQRRYDEAITVAKRATEYLPSNINLSNLITNLENRKSVNIVTLKIFNNDSWFSWNEKEKADVFGNDYSNVANCVVVRGTQAAVNKGAEYYVMQKYKSISGKVEGWRYRANADCGLL